ncbi:hypothetical protein [Methylomarinovum tepidoasis]|uniref:hypothetical protein n=1 Tax=Methylomarinovum tepidoasis TaxID=2840183 RepID=UPI0025740CA6|nr:hypothetical protein [Methylomarinovum sp. IN45]
MLLLLLLLFMLLAGRSEAAISERVFVRDGNGFREVAWKAADWLSTAADGVGGVIASGRAPVPTSAGSIPVDLTKNVSRGTLAAAARVLVRANPAIMAASLGLELYNIFYDSNTNTLVKHESAYMCWQRYDGYYPDPMGYDACVAWLESSTSQGHFDHAEDGCSDRGYSGAPAKSIYMRHNTQNYLYFWGCWVPSSTQTQNVTATDQDVEQAIDQKLQDDPNSALPIYQQVLQSGQNPTGTVQTFGPSTVQGPTITVTKTLSDGTPVTETTMTSYDITYQGDTVTVTKNISTTVVNNVTGQTIDQSTTTETPPPESQNQEPEKEYSLNYQNSDLPEVPDFYDPVYPNGFSDVWDSATQGYDQTPLVQWLQSQTSGLPDSGTCPSWTWDFNLGVVNLGTHQLQPPCEIWPWIRAFVLVTAIFAARAIIFGG